MSTSSKGKPYCLFADTFEYTAKLEKGSMIAAQFLCRNGFSGALTASIWCRRYRLGTGPVEGLTHGTIAGEGFNQGEPNWPEPTLCAASMKAAQTSSGKSFSLLDNTASQTIRAFRYWPFNFASWC
jgi:hypothetical protein